MFKNVLSQSAKSSIFQQVRYSRKTYRLRYAYGLKPIISEDQYEEVKANNRLEELRYEKIRFATLMETSSVFYDKKYELFCKNVMRHGNRSLAECLMRETFYQIKCIQYKKIKKREMQIEDGVSKPDKNDVDEESQKIEFNPLTIFHEANKNSAPAIITQKVKRGGAIYQVPCPLLKPKSEWYAIKWLISAVKDRPKPKKKLFPEVMARELLDAADNKGQVVKRRDDQHKLAEANKAYAHYRWG